MKTFGPIVFLLTMSLQSADLGKMLQQQKEHDDLLEQLLGQGLPPLSDKQHSVSTESLPASRSGSSLGPGVFVFWNRLIGRISPFTRRVGLNQKEDESEE